MGSSFGCERIGKRVEFCSYIPNPLPYVGWQTLSPAQDCFRTRLYWRSQWGLVGAFDWNLVEVLLGNWPVVVRGLRSRGSQRSRFRTGLPLQSL